jgi:hypothetical protein
MKRCPKCNRTYPTDTQKFCTRDGGLLETVADASSATGPINAPPAKSADTGPLQPFDPYKTIVEQPRPTQSPSPLAATVSLPANPPAPTGPIHSATLPPPTPPVAPQQKSNRTGLILGVVAVLLVLGVVVIGAAYVVIIRPRLTNRAGTSNSNRGSRQPVPQPTRAATPAATPVATPTQPVFNPPPNTTQFVNSKDQLDGSLSDHYLDFSFYYPNNWIKDATAGVSGAKNFAKVERRLPPDFTQENFAVGYYTSTGSDTTDRDLYAGFVKDYNSRYQKQFPEYHKVSEGEIKVGIYQGYEFRFEAFSRNTEKGDLKIWGRTIFLPPPDGGKNGAMLVILATSLAPELKSINDVGEKGELPIILDSFRFGKQ